MSSKKVIKATVNYAELFNRVPPDQVHHFKMLVAKNKQYKERLQELPEEPPKINWDYYKSNVRSEFRSLVEEFEKKYNELKIPYPEDSYSCQIDEMAKDAQQEIKQYIDQSNSRIQKIEEKICEVESQISFLEMTMEEFCIACPEIAPDFINRPTFWPHTEDEQLPTHEEKVKESSAEDASKDKKSPPDKTE